MITRAPRQRDRPVRSWKSREPDVKTVLRSNPDWWGWKDTKFDGNVTEIIYTPIRSDATRIAALIVGAGRLRSSTRRRRTSRGSRRTRLSRSSRAPRTGSCSRHRPAARRAAVLERQGQEPVQGQARAPGAVPGDRHRGDPQAKTMRGSVAADRRHHASRSQRPTPRSSSACRSIRARAQTAAGRRRLSRRASRSARLPEQPLHQRRGDLRRRGGDAGAQIGIEVKLSDAAARDLLPEAGEAGDQLLHARLGRRDHRCADHAVAGAALLRQGKRRGQLQLRALQRTPSSTRSSTRPRWR